MESSTFVAHGESPMKKHVKDQGLGGELTGNRFSVFHSIEIKIGHWLVSAKKRLQSSRALTNQGRILILMKWKTENLFSVNSRPEPHRVAYCSKGIAGTAPTPFRYGNRSNPCQRIEAKSILDHRSILNIAHDPDGTTRGMNSCRVPHRWTEASISYYWGQMNQLAFF